MSDIVRVQLDLALGTISIEAPPESLDTVFERLQSFLPQLADVYSGFTPPAAAEPDDSGGTGDEKEPVSDSEGSGSTRTAKGKRGSRGEAAKETYKAVELGLDETQRTAFRQFFAEKAPAGQNDQVLTIMYWLQKEAGKPSLDRDQIFTGFRTVDVPVPGRIGSVLSNLRLAGMIVTQDDGRHALHHVGEDHVKFKLPKKKST